MKADLQTQRAVGAGWWPLDWLRSLGRAASIAAGHPAQSQGEYRGFRILTTSQDGAYVAHITHHRGQAIARQVRRHIDTAQFDSREEALQHARFVITSGALRHLVRNQSEPS